MNIYIQFHVPIYKVNIQVTLCDNIWDYFIEQNYRGTKDVVDNYQAVVIDCTSHPDRNYSYDLVVSNDDCSLAGVVAHECYHIVNLIMSGVGARFSDDSEEPYAYLLTHLVDEVIEKVILLKSQRGDDTST